MAPWRDIAAEQATALRGRTVGVFAPLLVGTYFGRVITAIGDATYRLGGRTLAFQTQHDRDGPGDLPAVGWDRADAFVVIIAALPVGRLRELVGTGKPVVLLSHRVEGMALPTVCPDNRLGTREAVSHLIAHGHERVAFVGNVAQYDLRQRFLGYQDALREVGIEPDPELFFAVDNNHEGGGPGRGSAIARQPARVYRPACRHRLHRHGSDAGHG